MGEADGPAQVLRRRAEGGAWVRRTVPVLDGVNAQQNTLNIWARLADSPLRRRGHSKPRITYALHQGHLLSYTFTIRCFFVNDFHETFSSRRPIVAND